MTEAMRISLRGRVGHVGVLCLAVMLSACGGSEDDTAPAAGIRISSAADIAQTSADDYNDNVSGVITGATLKRWKDDWLNERPAGITGKLVILQVSDGSNPAVLPPAPNPALYVKPNGTNVVTYLAPSAEWVQTRSNGVITTQSMVLDGPGIDALLKKYSIDPTKDMVVCAQGWGSTGNAMAQGRCWYTLRYWGVDAAHLALLNGGNNWLATGPDMSAADFTDKASTPPNNGTFSVRALTMDNTVLQATLQDMLAVVPSSDANELGDGVFIWDARNLGQYSAGEMLELGEDTDPVTAGIQACATTTCDPAANPNYTYMASFQNAGSRQGHPWGALQLQFTRLLDSASGFSYRPKSVLQGYLDGGVDANGIGFMDASYQPVGATRAYQPGDTIYTYCETTMRAMITGIASGVILGKPTRFYDGAMVEWNSLSHLQDATGNFILPVDSTWRTDNRSYYQPAVSPLNVATRDINDAYARSADAIVREDRLYKLGGADSGAGGGGAALPANPCGG